MKKIIALLLSAVIAFSAFAVAGYAEDAPAISGVHIAQWDVNSDDADRVINWYEANGEYYLFIPASIDYDAAWFVVPGAETINATIDGAACPELQRLGEAVGDKTEVTLAAKGEEYKVNIIKISGTASVFIKTESGSLDYIHAVKGNEEEGLIEIADKNGETVYEGGLEIKGRGNSTWQMEKKPYNIKIADKTNLFGMGKTKKWSLIANHGDETLMRNVLAYEAAQKAGMDYTPQYTPVDLYINNNYMGSYLLTTRIGIDGSNVDIEDLEGETEDVNDNDLDTYARGGAYGTYAGLLEGTMKYYEIPNNPADITGGYIIEMELANRYADEVSGFVTTRSQPFTMKSPEYASKAQMEYISSYYQQVEDAIYNGASMAELGKLLNVESLAQMYLLNEWASNQDASLTSTYFYKPANDVLYAGPAWDFDIAFGNNGSERFGNDYKDPSKWTVCYNRMYRNTVFGSWDVDEQPTVYNVISKNEGFQQVAKAVWDNGMKTAVESTYNWLLKEYYPSIESSAIANAIRWNIFGTDDVLAIESCLDTNAVMLCDFAEEKADTITAGIGTVQTDAPETNAVVKFFKGFLVGVNNIFEKAIVAFDLVNKI